MTELPFLPFAKPALSEAAIEEVVACLRSGWITTGPRVAKFEGMLADYHGGRRALALSSATAGLQLALMAIGLSEGDEVITTPLTFVATLNTIVLAGGKPVLVDIDPATQNIDATKIEAAITPKTRAIMPVHYAGLPCDMDAIYALAKKHNLRVVEDCAHAIGAEFGGKGVGSFGDIAVMSFHPNKNMTTGEGGAVITDDAAVAEKIERLRFHGIDRSAFNRFTKTGSQEYDVVLPGYKYNMMDMQAALGIHQLPELDGFIARRTELAQRYIEALKDWPELDLPTAPDYAHKHAWHLFTPRLKTMERDAFMNAMKAENIGVGLHYQATHIFSWYREHLGVAPEDFPHALSVGQRIVSLPLFPTMTDDEQARVINSLAKVLRNG
ncbi:MAG: DegT/DnrJ/EryC1/StrS family aminotransferase [Alphaproteobacteria bacterium]|nr:DegT/DnrJ/EryC1/StrS family aminotransferase [Alphaproteobacteria bacterium]